MASAPSDLGPVTGRVDRDGRLIAADPALLPACSRKAGSKLGAPLALPATGRRCPFRDEVGLPVAGGDRRIQ